MCKGKMMLIVSNVGLDLVSFEYQELFSLRKYFWKDEVHPWCHRSRLKFASCLCVGVGIAGERCKIG
jgi:hypothetical protein